MNKYIKNLLFFAFICLSFFLSDKYIVNADTFDAFQFEAQLYDNNNGYLSATTTTFGNNYWQGYIPTMVANSSGGAWGISSPISLLKGHTYSLTIDPGNESGCNPILSTYNRIGLGNSMDSAKNSYQNNTNVDEKYSTTSTSVMGPVLQFAFTAKENGSFLVVPFSTSCSANDVRFTLNSVIISDLGSESLSQTDINNSLTSQTNEINTSINSAENNINSSIKDTENNINENVDNMEQNIIDSNNQTQEVIKDQFNDCRNSVNLFDKDKTKDYFFYNSSGTTTNASPNTFINQEIELSNNYVISYSNRVNDGGILAFVRFVEYDASGTYIKRTQLEKSGSSITLDSNTKKLIISVDAGPNAYFENLQIEKGTVATSYEPYGEKICKNKIDSTNDKLDDLNSSLNDSDSSGATDNAGNFFSGFESEDFGLTSIITSPLNLIKSITSSTCSPLPLKVPFLDNQTLNLPCMTTIYKQHFGSFLTIYQTITFGIISYWVCVNIFAMVKGFKDPESDKVEVLDL